MRQPDTYRRRSARPVLDSEPQPLSYGDVSTMHKAAKEWGRKHPNPITWRRKKMV